MVNRDALTATRRNVLKASSGAVAAPAVSRFIEDVEDVDEEAEAVDWDATYDLVIVGSGGAGEAAGIAAADEGADAVILERLDTFGGDTRHSGGITHFGGGTVYQEQNDVDESPEEYYDYLSPRIGKLGSDEHIRMYAANSAEHFDWALEHDTPFEEELSYSGAERAWPYREITEPKMHGHQADPDGAAFWQAFHESAVEAGVDHVAGAEVQRLLRDGERIVGVVAAIDDEEQYIRGEDGIVLATGGFEANEEMMRQHLPEYLDNPSLSQGMHLGHGIQMGIAAGADTMNMSESWSAVYFIPEQMRRGILVNEQGRRTITEDHYPGTIGEGILDNPYRGRGETSYFIIDDETASEWLDDFEAWNNIGYATYDYLGEANSYEEITELTDVDTDSIRNTIEFYNEHAAEGEDPHLHKHPDLLAPIEEPWQVWEVPGDIPIYITWGGLMIDTETRVLDPYGEPIEGLYSAGRNAIGMGFAEYDSGMSLADITFWGRIAGKVAVAGEEAHPYTNTLDVEEPEEPEEVIDDEDVAPYVREVEEWLADDDTFEEIEDHTGEDEVTVLVGVEGNGEFHGYEPSALEVSPGTTVVWEWLGLGFGHHDVVATDNSFQSELTLEEGHTFEHTFEEEGLHRYYCTPHIDVGMKGAVVVNPTE